MDIVVSYDCLPKIGGAHLWLYEVYKRWTTEVQLFTTEYSGDPQEAGSQRDFDRSQHGALRILRHAVPFQEISLLDVACLNTFRHNVQHMRRLANGPSVQVHSLRAFPEGFTSLLYARTRFNRTKLITYAHGEDVLIAQTSSQLRLMARRVYAGSDLVIANSESTRRLIEVLCPSARIACIHPGVDVAAYDLPGDDVSAYRGQWDWPAGTIVLCTIARMEPRKNHAAVIRAVAILRNRGVPVSYVCAGSGPELSALRQLAQSLYIEPWVLFAGAVSEREKRMILVAADIHIMPSIQTGAMIEGFGIVFLEAAASGKPSVCGSSGGQAEAVKDGQTGIIVDGSSDDQICEALTSLIQNPANRTRMGRMGRAWAAENNWPLVAQRVAAEISAL